MVNIHYVLLKVTIAVIIFIIDRPIFIVCIHFSFLIFQCNMVWSQNFFTEVIFLSQPLKKLELWVHATTVLVPKYFDRKKKNHFFLELFS